MSTSGLQNTDRKDRVPSPAGSGSSHGNVVDHTAPHVTDDTPAKRAGVHENPYMITVQPLRATELQPSYAQDLGTGDVKHGAYGSCLHGLGSVVGCLGAIPCCPFPNPFRNVQQGSVGLVTRFGQFYKSVNVCTESIRIVDVKIQIISIGRQTVITRDNVNVEIDSVIYFQITNPDLRQALIERAQTTLRHVVGARAVQSVVTEREAIAFEIAEIVGDVADKWGVAIEGILIKDITLSPQDVAASLSSAAQQKRIGESKVIAARAEVDAARLMRQAADILASPAAMQIRQLEALQQMAKKRCDIMGQLAGGSNQVASGSGTVLRDETGEGISAAGRAGLLSSVEDV
ncbi:hypothetical protein EDD16DRAFT_1882373 [Pisolithus croceorrhizus]|nr:hypothetical protein EDD16DRAFT_1882373 [Pisolithus croceorrhizus]